MKAVTRQQYLPRIDRVLARLQASLQQGGALPALAELAALAHLSPYHFHRQWRALTGEPLGATLGRLRLRRALHLLGESSLAVGAVAAAVGYETPQALARVMREQLGHSPSALRADASARALAERRLAAPSPVDAQLPALRVEVLSQAPFALVALRQQGAFAELDQAYNRLFDWAARAGLQEQIVGLYGVPHGDHRDLPAAELVYDCAIALATPVQPPAPLHALTLGGGRYARVSHRGSYQDLEALTDRLLAQWLPASGEAVRDAPIHIHYLDDPEQVAEAALRSAVYLPLREPAAD